MLYNIYSDSTINFVKPIEPKLGEYIKIRIRIDKGLVPNFYINIKTSHDEVETIKMYKGNSHNGFDYYYVDYKLESNKIDYYFQYKIDDKKFYYNKNGLSENLNDDYNFRIFADYKTPKWSKGAVLYQIFVDRFYNGDKRNDVLDGEYKYLEHKANTVEWNYPVELFDVTNFHGGDLQGIIDKIDYLQDLGVDGIYLNPIFVSPSNHKYDIQDYENIDPHIGVIIDDDGTYKKRTTSKLNLDASNKLFKKLIDILHDKGMYIIIDGVFNHCGDYNKWMDSYNIYSNDTVLNKDNPYREYFKFDDNNEYEKWWGNKTLPKLNYENSDKLFNEIQNIGIKWVDNEYGIDGWRLDVAADLGHTEEYNHYFWSKFRSNIKKVNDECLILAEHYGDPSAWLDKDQWDSVMNYDAFMEPVSWFFTGMDKHSDSYREDLLNNDVAFWGMMNHYSSLFPYQSILCSMNQLSNHDHSRFLTRTNHSVGRLKDLGTHLAQQNVKKNILMLATVLQMTWIGCPTLYYGDEIGLCGYTDPDNRRAFPWGREDQKLKIFFKSIIKLRKDFSDVFTYGSIINLYSSYGCLVYARILFEKVIIVCINNTNNSIHVELPIFKCGIPKNGIMFENFQTVLESYHKYNDISYKVKDSIWSMHLEANSSRIFSYIREDDRF